MGLPDMFGVRGGSLSIQLASEHALASGRSVAFAGVDRDDPRLGAPS